MIRNYEKINAVLGILLVAAVAMKIMHVENSDEFMKYILFFIVMVQGFIITKLIHKIKDSEKN